MRRLILWRAWFCALALVALAAPVQAFSNRTYVSSAGCTTCTGCPQSSPCATFAAAAAFTADGGEIDCIGSGDFGPVSIIKSITIDCGEGNVGTMETNGGTAVILINTGSSATVVLRHLSLNGFNGTGTGIAASMGGGALIVEHCVIQGFTSGDGIDFDPNGSRASLQVSDTVVYNNQVGINVAPAASNTIASLVLDGVKINDNTSGLLLGAGNGIVAGTLRHSVVAENNANGVFADASQVFLTVEESSIIDNLNNGIISETPGVNIEVGASTLGGNGTGVSVQNGAIFTFGNNQMSANGSNGSFTPGGPGLQ